MKKNGFEETYKIIRDLEDTDLTLVESLFHYSMTAKREHDKESRIVAKDYKNGSLDPTSITSRFEKE